MGRNRFVKPKTVRLDLSDGDWVDVKRELNAGEHRRVFSRMVKEMRAGEKTTIDPEQVGLSKLVEYIVDWSFEDNGKAIPVSASAFNALDAETFTELVKMVDTHEEAVEAEIEARKNDQAGEKASSPISPSASS